VPKELTHWMLAERALTLLPAKSRLAGIIARNRKAYLGGAVLPDTLAHLFRGPFHPTARMLGQLFHDPPGNSYQPLVRAESSFPEGLPEPLLSCFLGVITHMEADAALHPYVYAKTGPKGIGEHYRLETAIDLLLLQSGKVPSLRRLARIVDPGTGEILVRSLGLLLDPDGKLPRRALVKALSSHCWCQSLYDQSFWRVAVRILAAAFGSPFREQQQLFYPPARSARPGKAGTESYWHHPESGFLMDRTLNDLMRLAVERTVELFLLIEKGGSLAVALTGVSGPNLLTGLHGVKKER